MYFYELHEGDNDVFADLLMAREEEMEPEEFFRVVQEIRERVMGQFSNDTLIEAIAEELERDHEFIFISDERLVASVNVSVDPAANFLADLEGGFRDEEDELGGNDADYRAILADFRPEPPRPN